MAAYTDFIPRVLMDAPGCPELAAEAAIKQAVIDFCTKSLLIQRDHDAVSVVAGIQDYDFEPPTDQLVLKIMKAWYKGYELSPMAADQINTPFAYRAIIPGANNSRDEPTAIYQKDERTFSLFPIPKESVPIAVTLRVALKPTRASTTCEDVIYEDHYETIAYGALARLLLSPGRPYSNPQLAAAFNLQFMQGTNAARQLANHGHVRSQMRVKFPRI